MRRSVLLYLLIVNIACENSQKKAPDKIVISYDETLQQDSSKIKALNEIIRTIPNNIKPVFGYRFIVTGDFNGDGIQEKLFEHFYSSIENDETNKFYDSLSDYDQLVALTVKKQVSSFITSDNKLIDTLHVTSEAKQLGLSYLKNEGDLNGDGTDEISYVVEWADWSSSNTCYLMTYQNKKWKELYSFPIWDWQLPILPEKDEQDRNLKEFKGLIKKIKTNRIQVTFRNDKAKEETKTIDLDR